MTDTPPEQADHATGAEQEDTLDLAHVAAQVIARIEQIRPAEPGTGSDVTLMRAIIDRDDVMLMTSAIDALMRADVEYESLTADVATVDETDPHDEVVFSLVLRRPQIAALTDSLNRARLHVLARPQQRHA